MLIHEVSALTGISVRTLQYYDTIGLLKPAEYTDSGYRIYDEASLTVLQEILLFRELEFPLKEIKEIISSPDYDRNKALTQQIQLLTLKKERLERLIGLAESLQNKGGNQLDFSAFDTGKIEEYAKQAKKSWGETSAYQEYEEKSRSRSKEDEASLGARLMEILARFGDMKDKPADCPEAQAQVQILKDYITTHYYNCTNEILSSLGAMYAAGGEFTKNIDQAGGPGTAEYANKAIQVYCRG